MPGWGEFEAAQPELAAFGAARLKASAAYLATVREDGSPRVHPVTPIIGEGRLMLYMEPTSPKGKDLQRGSRYQLHCGVEDNSGGGGEFYITGSARLIDPSETAIWESAKRVGYEPKSHYVLFELSIDSAFTTKYTATGVERGRWKA
jgi:hypothetical protein